MDDESDIAPIGGALQPVPYRGRDRRRFDNRLVVGLIVGGVVATTTILVAVVAAVDARISTDPGGTRVFDLPFTEWSPSLSAEVPAVGLIAAAVSAVVLVALCSIGLELIASWLAISPRREHLERLRSIGGRRAAGQRVRVTVLIPAHDEEVSLPMTLRGLARQTRRPDRVIVVADNCSDRTPEIAVEMGYECLVTVGNTEMKGGALNQALSIVLPHADVDDVVLVMDADTVLADGFIESGAALLEADRELAAVGGIFAGEGGHGLVGQFQRNEYARYSLQIRQRRGRVFVLTGTASMFRAEALLDVAAARGVYIPGDPGKVYDTSALTEDNELTLALKSLGATMMSPPECTVVTELMPSWRTLWRQRKRWMGGALENLGAYGLTRATLRYWGQQFGLGFGVVALVGYLLLMAVTLLAFERWMWFVFWMFAGGIFVLERVLTAWSAGWRGRLLALSVLPELLYDLFLQIVFVVSMWNILRARQQSWGHVEHRGPTPSVEAS